MAPFHMERATGLPHAPPQVSLATSGRRLYHRSATAPGYPAGMHFTSTLESAGKTAAGFEVPDAVMDGLAGGRRPKVRVTINGHTWRTSVGIVDGRSMIGIPVDQRAAARVTPGDVLDVDVELDTEVRDVVMPDDFAAALAPFLEARAFFDSRNYSERRWFVLGIEDAKTPETRARRVEKAVERLREGRGQR